MGYRRVKPVYVLKFEDPELAELEVRAKGASVGQLMKLMDLARFAVGGHKFTAEDFKDLGGLFELFASKLISWNLEDEDGTPIPATVDGLNDQDMDFALDLVLAWVSAVIGVSAPLGQPSTDGTPFPEGSIPMETLSLNQ